MGMTKEESVSESLIVNQKKKSLIFTAIMLIIGLFSPVLISVFNYGMMPDVFVQGMFWTYRQSSQGWYENGFSIIDSYMWMSMFPFLLLRMVPVSQIYRYYNGKTTRKRVFAASIIGDGYMLFSGLLITFLAFGYGDTFHIPLPFQIIFSIFVLLIFRIPKPTTPWKSEEEPKSWWEKKPETQEDAPSEDEDKLW